MLETILAALPEYSLSLPLIGMVDVTKFCVAVSLVVVVVLFTKSLLMIILNRLEHVSSKTSVEIDDVLIKAVQSIRSWVYITLAVALALQLYTLPQWGDLTVRAIMYFVIAWQAIEFLVQIIDYVVRQIMARDEDGDGQVDPGAATASEMVTLMVRIVLWALGGLFVLSNLGVEVTSLIAGLGIGGVAVAFALQGVLSDLFASFSIYFDKPFRIGDFVVIGPDAGTVEKIGIKSTRIRTLQGEELVVSNAELTTTRVQNFKRMDERRIVTQFGVEYDTPVDTLEKIPSIIRDVFDHLEGARLDRAHFSSLGDFSLNFEVVYFVHSSDYNEYMDIQQRYNLALMRACQEHGVAFAFPTQTIYQKQG